jgi:hypothetical protein
MSEDPGRCPHCGGESDGSHMYSAPPQTQCRDCGKRWSFGKGIEMLSEEEGRKKRPELYEWSLPPCGWCGSKNTVPSKRPGCYGGWRDCLDCGRESDPI